MPSSASNSSSAWVFARCASPPGCTGILAIPVSGAFAVTVSTVRRRKRLPAFGFGLLTAVLFYALVQNVIDKPDGLAIAHDGEINLIANRRPAVVWAVWATPLTFWLMSLAPIAALETLRFIRRSVIP